MASSAASRSPSSRNELEVGKAVDLLDLLVTKGGFPRAQAEAANARLTAQGREFGLDFRFDRAVTTNTLDAHRRTHFAKAAGRQRELVERLFRAYFTGAQAAGAVRADLTGEDVDLLIWERGVISRACDRQSREGYQRRLTFVLDGLRAPPDGRYARPSTER